MADIPISAAPYGRTALDDLFSGIHQGQQEYTQNLSNQRMGLENVVKGRDAMNAQAEMSPEYQQSRLAGMMGENQSKQAKGFVDYNSMDASLKSKLAEAHKSATADGIAAERMAIDKFLAAGESSGFNPVMMLSTIEDPQMKQQVAQIVQQQGPQAAYQLAKNMREMYIQMDADTGKQRGEIAKQELANKGHKETTGMTNATNIKLEQMRINAGKYNKAGTSKSVEEALLTAKNPVHKAEILEQAYQIAVRANDVSGAAGYASRAQEARQRVAEDFANRGLAAQATNVSAPVMTGLPANPAPSAQAPIAGGGIQRPTNTPAKMWNPQTKKWE